MYLDEDEQLAYERGAKDAREEQRTKFAALLQMPVESTMGNINARVLSNRIELEKYRAMAERERARASKYLERCSGALSTLLHAADKYGIEVEKDSDGGRRIIKAAEAICGEIQKLKGHA